MEEKLVTKDDLLNKLRAYSDTPDDDNIVYKQKIKDALLSNPTLLYLLHEKDLEVELFDEDGNINWEFDAATGKYKPLGEWDRYFGGKSNIRPYLFIPDTQTNVKHYNIGDDFLDLLQRLIDEGYCADYQKETHDLIKDHVKGGYVIAYRGEYAVGNHSNLDYAESVSYSLDYEEAKFFATRFNMLPAIHSIIGNSGFCAILNKKADNT